MRISLLPISFFYHLVLYFRHQLYDWHLLRSKSFEQPVICVGNLALGGTGKTPHVEYLIQLLRQYRVCVVSRGYGRKTKGFQLGNASCCAETIGDEPMQYLNKFKDVLVAVDKNRNEAIELMDTIDIPPDVYLLDDAFQHRSTQAGLNILLTAYDRLYCDDFLVPTGTLRDIRSAAKRAHMIVVTKSPPSLDNAHKTEIIERLKPLPHQKVYFSSLEYDPLKAVNPTAHQTDPEEADTMLLFCGIAHPEPLVDQLKKHCQRLEVMTFADHHTFTLGDVKNIMERFGRMEGNKKIIVTTEKDYARFINSPYLCSFDAVPLFVAPISVKIDEEEKFNEEILSYVRKNAHHG